MNTLLNRDELMKKIKKVRRDMIASGTTKGLSHAETVQYSQELDELMNQFQPYSKF
ncbi:aspartyl-phosphate phosphatase Spo0E family protein [Domibacillus sp. DTU_2020_1001157_1_SI_ALB_TIR_016]|uniref:aspartyl-phosphate phosphatase Spo0E family protein n=1 Tax=Domibacillus sp. DTU_2020_1001157_1_SI_ALB_TIR_016 TaxID=3077789 RepID=UPI0028EFEC96|nr:aspartyl-phosphate phosphatase Spo0E family protein [Domibacillus sp. DTU_2020_1001157_1_SI_ALB_TIR_016]WNS79946.1 aspartyl-phosphate phosphatase Spo0E family protein [Domibacillus sp. DTU_2020_1001157_1_SI_ALB_TIR_016]